MCLGEKSNLILLPVQRMSALLFCFSESPTRLLPSWMPGSGLEDWVCNATTSWSLSFMTCGYWPVSPAHHVDTILIGWRSLPCQMTVHAAPAWVSQVVVPPIVPLSLILGHKGQLSIVTNNQQFQGKTLIFARPCLGTERAFLFIGIVSIDDWPIPCSAFHLVTRLPVWAERGHTVVPCSADQPWLSSTRSRLVTFE